MTIKITFLGTSDAIPSKKRNHTSILLNYNDENILVDCGEGTQRQLRKVKISPTKITRILLTHWHGDHILGIPGLIQTNALIGRIRPLYIYGPKGTKKFMKEILKTFVFAGDKYKLIIKEVTNEKFLETKDFYIECKSMIHNSPCNAYSFIKKEKIRINKEKLKKIKLPNSPILSKLSQGKDIIFKGKKYKASQLTYKTKPKKISFVLDTKINPKITAFVKNSDILISESTFSIEEEKQAKEHFHLTSKQAGEIAKKSKSKKLILTHISQRYEKNPEKILKETKKIFKNSQIAKDLDSIEI